MNLSTEWADLLNGRGHDALHRRELRAADAQDDVILTRAAEEDRIVFTADLDFGTMVATRGLNRPSVVQLRLDNTDPLLVGSFVLSSIAAVGTALCGGAILTIDSGHARFRPGFGAISQGD